MTTMKARDIVGSKLSRSNSNRMLVKELYILNVLLNRDHKQIITRKYDKTAKNVIFYKTMVSRVKQNKAISLKIIKCFNSNMCKLNK